MVLHRSGHRTRFVGTATSRVALGAVSPKISLMSISLGLIPSGNSQLKQCNKWATAISSPYKPSCIPGQDRRPDPNGMNSKLFPLKSGTPCSRNLAGRNVSGSSHDAGSLPMAHAFTMTRDFAGMK